MSTRTRVVRPAGGSLRYRLSDFLWGTGLVDAQCAPFVVAHKGGQPGGILLGVSLGQRAAQSPADCYGRYVQSLREGALNDVPGRLGSSWVTSNLWARVTVRASIGKHMGNLCPYWDGRLPILGVDVGVSGDHWDMVVLKVPSRHHEDRVDRARANAPLLGELRPGRARIPEPGIRQSH
ncbi:MAG TPA: hypothetical protein VMF65_20460 [Acidimicrobiales bacterium]|nr:hypothetical protein [Acidimicrobiales bacterium]